MRSDRTATSVLNLLVVFATLASGEMRVHAFETPPLGTLTVFNITTNSSIFEIPAQGASSKWGLGSGEPRNVLGFVIASLPENACDRISRNLIANSKTKAGTVEDDDDGSGEFAYDWILIANDLDCKTQLKIDNAAQAGFSVLIIFSTTSNDTQVLGNDVNDLTDMSIPTYSVGNYNGKLLKNGYTFTQGFYATIVTPPSIYKLVTAIVVWIGFVFAFIAVIVGLCKPICHCCAEPYIRKCIRTRRQSLLTRAVNEISPVEWNLDLHHSNYESCVICLEKFEDGDSMRILHCLHAFHTKCIDVWLIRIRRYCPICKAKFRYSSVWEDTSDSEISEGNYMNESSSSAVLTQNRSARHRERGPDHEIPGNSGFLASSSGFSSSGASLDGSLYYSTQIEERDTFGSNSTLISYIDNNSIAQYEDQQHQQQPEQQQQQQWHSVSVESVRMSPAPAHVCIVQNSIG